MSVPVKKLVNGVEVPMLGIGMDQVRDLEKGYQAVSHALKTGYRSVDTASSYGNEECVGRAIRESGIPRESIYVTSKVKAADQGYDSTLLAFDKSLKNFNFDYLDCYLIHWPGKYLYIDTWHALERIYQEKRARVIGVCNCNTHHLKTIFENSEIKPMVDQMEWHPYFSQKENFVFCKEHNISFEAWSPLMCGGDVLEDKSIQKIADKYNKTPGQIILHWHIQSDRRVFPKSVTPHRIEENFNIFDFQLTPEEITVLDSLSSKDMRIGPDPDIYFDRG